ncbi:hypothetical protein Tco_1297915, partial [Tanacetum coccineum]
LGYNATTASPAVDVFVNLSDKSGLDKGYLSVPRPLIGNFIPCKPDLTFMDEIVESENLDVTTVVTPSNEKTVENKGVFNTVESNTVRRECCASINEELVSDVCDGLGSHKKMIWRILPNRGGKMLKLMKITLVQMDAQTQGRHEHNQEFDAEITTTGDSIEDIAAKTLVYIRRSASKAKDKGKAKMEESELAMTKKKRQKEQERLGFEVAVRLQAELDKEERQRISRAQGLI